MMSSASEQELEAPPRDVDGNVGGGGIIMVEGASFSVQVEEEEVEKPTSPARQQQAPPLPTITDDDEGESSPASVGGKRTVEPRPSEEKAEQGDDGGADCGEQETVSLATSVEEEEPSSTPPALLSGEAQRDAPPPAPASEGIVDASTSSEEERKAESMALNDAFTALERMRVANLELELGCEVDRRHCVTCLRREAERKRAGQRGTWGIRRRIAVPCLVCSSPTCQRHASAIHRREKLTICGHCAPLFGLDFIIDLIHNDDDTAYRRAAVDQVVDSYDRAVIMLKYSSQYIDSTIEALERTAERDNRIGLGSSATGLVSGITGVAAAAVHFAAISTLAAATVLTPVGPPLLIASIVFGGTAAAASSGSEAVSYYSEPNQLANRIMALHELVNSLLKVTVTLRDALTRGHINLEHYVKNNKILKDSKSRSFVDDSSEVFVAKGKDEDASSHGDSPADAEDIVVSAQTTGTDQLLARTNSEEEELVEVCSINTSELAGDDDEEVPCSAAEGEAGSGEGEDKADISSVYDDESANEDLARIVNESAHSVEEEEEAETSGVADASEKLGEDGSPMKKATPSNAGTETKVVASSGNIRQAVTRAATNTLKAAQVASAACGVLSVASIILEAKNISDAVERMKEGNKHPKAEILMAIKEEIDKLPDTSLIADQCESYLKHQAAVQENEE